MDKQARIARYAADYDREYGFESAMVASRQRLLLELLERQRPSTVLEIGCGSELLYRRALEAALPIRRWITVEPSDTFAAGARAAASDAIELRVVQDFIEDAAGSLRDLLPEGADVVLMAGMLHEVEEPTKTLKQAGELVAARGLVHVDVPNAFSMHRRLARAMQLIPHETARSERNDLLQQFHVFTVAELISLVEMSGLVVEETGGYFLKPFTHAQMNGIAGLLTPEMLDGLWQLGRELPEWASEIYVNARRQP